MKRTLITLNNGNYIYASTPGLYDTLEREISEFKVTPSISSCFSFR